MTEPTGTIMNKAQPDCQSENQKTKQPKRPTLHNVMASMANGQGNLIDYYARDVCVSRLN